MSIDSLSHISSESGVPIVEQLRELAQEINAVAEDIERMRGAMQQTLKKIQGVRDGP